VDVGLYGRRISVHVREWCERGGVGGRIGSGRVWFGFVV
jgi:hypothetical protein